MSHLKRLSKLGTSAALCLSLCANALAQDNPAICRMEPSTPEGGGKLLPEYRKMVAITPDGDDADIFKNGNFSFSSTIAQILRTSLEIPLGATSRDAAARRDAISSPDAQREFVASLLRTFWDTARSNSNGVVNDATRRPNEAALTADDVMKRMKPVGLFNRLDLAPASLDFCGEHRIVYAMDTAGLVGFQGPNRFFLIFEAAVDNPDPKNARAGCLRIANFWKRLPGMEAAARAAALHRFYYDGDLGEGASTSLITPVVHNRHYGVPFGQIRGNVFMTNGDIGGNPWMLREWRTQTLATGTRLIDDTVKSNPVPEFYSDDAIRTDGTDHGRVQAFADLRPEFRKRFALSNVRELIDIDLKFAIEGRRPEAADLVNGISALFDEKFNDFESISQGTGIDNIRVHASANLEDEIAAELKKYRLPDNWDLTPKHILARAEALSCGGCHQLTTGSIEIAPGVTWPTSAGFVHVTETGALSPALEEQFLPARCRMMDAFINDRLTPVMPTPMPAPVAATAGSMADAVAEVREATETLRAVAAEAAPVAEPQPAAPTAADLSRAEADLSASVDKARQDLGRAGGAFRIGNRTH